MVSAVVGIMAMTSVARGAVYLGDLVSTSGSITVGDKTFSGFSWTVSGSSPDVIAALNSQAGGLFVSAYISGDRYILDFGGLLAVNNLMGNNPLSGDLQLVYTVTANPGPMNGIDEGFTPNAIPAFGDITIAEIVRNGLGAGVASSTLTLNPTDLSDPPAEGNDQLNISPGELLLQATTDISITAYSGQLAGLSDLQQSFHQVPEPLA